MPDSGHEALSKALKALQANPDNPEEAIRGFENEAAELRARADALEQIANGIRGLAGNPVPMPTGTPISGAAHSPFPQPSRTPPTGTPEGMEAVRQVMRERDGVWTVREIFDEIKRRGWESKDSDDPIRPTEAALSRLSRVKREVERVGRGKYRYVGPNGSRAIDAGLFNGAGT